MSEFVVVYGPPPPPPRKPCKCGKPSILGGGVCFTCFEKEMAGRPKCPYCGMTARPTTGEEIYPHRPDLHEKKFFLCSKCHAYVGCHVKTGKPLGRLANAELRKLKMAAHAAFDSLWKNPANPLHTRTTMYAWLAKKMDIKSEYCHIGMFDEDQCRKVIAVCRERC